MTVSESHGPQRLFAEWSMSFGQVTVSDVDQVFDAVQAPQPLTGLCVNDTCLRTLLRAFAGPSLMPDHYPATLPERQRYA